jgi:hypothetical protein
MLQNYKILLNYSNNCGAFCTSSSHLRTNSKDGRRRDDGGYTAHDGK